MSHRHRASVVILLLSLAAAAWAQPGSSPPPGAPGVDHVKDLLDDYAQGDERVRFFDAAGVDGELDKDEFQAAAGKPKSFVRAYDRWDQAAPFDKDGNGKINWVEAERYRQSIRDRVLGKFDADKDGKLSGPERDAANEFLRAGLGKAEFAAAAGEPASRPTRRRGARGNGATGGQTGAGGGQPAGESTSRSAAWNLRDTIAKYDKDGDGKLNDEERKAVADDLRQQAQQLQTRLQLQRYDKNKDGVLDDQERAEMEKDGQQRREQLEKTRQEWIKRWDTDGDGKLSQEEQEAMREQSQRAGRSFWSTSAPARSATPPPPE